MRRLTAAVVLVVAAFVATTAGGRGQEALPFVESFDDRTPAGWELDAATSVVDGVLRVLDGGIAYAPLQLGDATITVRDGDHEVRVDGAPVLRATDPDPVAPAGFGFSFQGDGRLEVDWVEVRAASTIAPPAASPTLARSALSWVRTGGPLGGLGYDVRMRPGDADRMYVTDALAGVFVSTDGGKTWAPSNSGITTRTGESADRIPVFCLTVDPHDPDTIWVGTQFTRGIFRSTDGGRTWTERDDGVVEQQGITFRGITVDPRDPSIVYAAAELSSWAWAGKVRNGREFDMTKGVVYRSTDAGAHWTAVWRGQNLARYIWIDPRDSDVIYVSTGIFDREAGDSDPVARRPGGEGVIKSTDGGRTWRRVNKGLGNAYVGSLFMRPGHPDVLLAGTGNNQYHDRSGVYLTTNGGLTWRQTLRNDVITAVEFSVSDSLIAYAGSSASIYRSSDGGRRWRRVAGPNGWGPRGVVAGFPIDFQVDPHDPDRIFANDYGGGNFVSTDGGRTWSVASAGYTGAQVRALAVDPGRAGRVYAAARSGLFRSDDGGATWIGLSRAPGNGLEWNAVAVDPADGMHVVAGNNWRPQVMVSRNGGATLTLAGKPLPEGFGFRAFAVAPGDPATVYAGTGAYVSAGQFSDELPAHGILVSHDGGRTWSEANDARSDDAQVADLAIGPADARRAFAATTNKGLLLTEDGGSRWAPLPGAGGAAWALSIAIDPSDADHLLAGLAPGGVHGSSDGGATWRTATGIPPESLVSDIVFDPTDPRTVYAADRSSGVYRSGDGGATWQRITTGLEMRSTNALALSSDGRHLYAATEGGGVYRLDLDGRPPS